MMTIPTFSISLALVCAHYIVMVMNVGILALKLNELSFTPTQVSLVFMSSSTVYTLGALLAGLVDHHSKNPYMAYGQVIVTFFLTGFFLTLQGPAPFYHITDPPVWLLLFSNGLQGIYSFGAIPAMSLMYYLSRNPAGQTT